MQGSQTGGRALTAGWTLACLLAAGCGGGKDTGGSGWDSSTDTGGDASDSVSDTGDTGADTALDTASDVEEEPCFATGVSAERGIAPVDIIWVVDSSGSMDYEEEQVQDNLNAFSSHIFSSGVDDYHVVLIGDAGSMSVPPPLGGSPDFLHINEDVDSNEALEAIINRYPDYRDFLRAGAVRHLVAVTDDESDMSAGEFVAALAGLADPGFPSYPWSSSPYGFTFHSIVAYGSIPIIGCVTGAAIGRQYLQLSDWTFGVTQQVCLTDWSPIFSSLETSIGVVTILPCAYDIPEPPAGETFNPDKVNTIYIPSGGTDITIPRVPDPASCTGIAYGWYYDDPADPAQIRLCPETCTIVQADPDGRIEIAFGCETVFI